MTVAFDRQSNIPRQVYDLLREKILTVEFKPGESINERRLSDWLGVSRTPIREAIRRLSDSGLISIVPHVGTSVSLINAKRVHELYLIRTSLEAAIARRAAERFDVKTEQTLSNLIDQHAATLDGPDFPRHMSVDNEFHRSIAESSGLTLTWEILQQVLGEVTRLRHLSIRLPGRLLQPIEEHTVILEALKTRNADKSERAMKTHLDRSYRSIVETLEHYPEYIER